MAPGPKVLLMDEPFASVDIVLRRRLRRDCRMVLREQGATTVLVTHDPDEAIDIADRIAVMEAGRIVQFGTPEQLHERPEAASVGAIFGGAQILSARRVEAGLATVFGTLPVTSVGGNLPETDELELLLFAGQIDLAPDPDGLTVRDLHPVGAAIRVLLVEPGGQEITVETSAPVSAGERYAIVPRAGSIRAFAHR
jgi:iron(III) transport system ATP-binding protein